jgi:hypothetical protein
VKSELLRHWFACRSGSSILTPTATLTLAEASLKAIPIAPEDIPARWWKPQLPKLDQDGLTKTIRARDKALKEAEALTGP